MLRNGFEPTRNDWAQEGFFFLCGITLLFLFGTIFPRLWILFILLFYGVFIVRIVIWVLVCHNELRKNKRLLKDYIQEVKAGRKTPTHPILRFYVLTYRFDIKREIPRSEIVHPFWRLSSLTYRLLVMRELPRSDSFFQEGTYQGYQEQGGQSYYEQPHDSSSEQYEQEERFKRRQEQRRRDEQSKQKAEGKQEGEGSSCFGILGITPEADYATAKKAHRDLLKKYHPDRVNDLGPELQELATKKLKEINTAWEEFESHWKLKNS